MLLIFSFISVVDDSIVDDFFDNMSDLVSSIENATNITIENSSQESGGKTCYFAKDIISYDLQIENLKNAISDYENKKLKLSDELLDFELQIKNYKNKLPIYYLVSENSILGFADNTYSENANVDIYKLVMIADNYENTIFINYEEYNSNNISSISNSKEQEILLEYEDSKLSKIKSVNDDVTHLEYDINGNLSKITYGDDDFTRYIYNNDNSLSMVISENGQGIKIEYASNKIIIKEFTLLTSINDNVVTLVAEPSEITNETINNYNLNYDISKIEYYDYKCTVITTDDNTTTYLFDNYGNPSTIYENEIIPDNNISFLPKVTNYSYNNGNEEIIIKNELSAHDFLTTKFVSSTHLESSYYLGDDDYLGDNGYLTSYISNDDEIHSTSTNEDIELTSAEINDIIGSNRKHFVLTDWAKADSACLDFSDIIGDSRYGRKYQLKAVVTGTDETQTQIQRTFSNNYDWMNTNWQMCAVGIDLSEFVTITSFIITFDYSYNTGIASYLNPKLQICDYTKNIYQDDNIIQSRTEDYITDYEYENDICVAATITDKSNQTYKISYTYNKENKLIKTIDNSTGLVDENVYNDTGFVIKTKRYNLQDPSNVLVKETKLDDKGNEKETLNEFGETIATSEYDDKTQLQLSSEDVNGNKTAYGYDKYNTLVSQSTSINGIENKNQFTYKNDLLTKISHNDFDISYDYDNKYRKTQIKVGGQQYASFDYIDKYTTRTTFNNNNIFENKVDKNGNLLETKYNGTQLKQNIYDSVGKLMSSKDNVVNEETEISYDNYGNATSKTVKQNNVAKLNITNTYDNYKNLSGSTIGFDSQTQNYTYQYDNCLNKKVTQIQLASKFTQNISYDLLERTKQIDTVVGNKIFTKQYSYLKNGYHTSNLISAEWFGLSGANKGVIHYSYDAYGNVTKIKNNGDLIVQYQYDSLSRLSREDNKKLNFTKIYEYDAGGNILEIRKYYFTIQSVDDESPIEIKRFSYRTNGWRDQLLGYQLKTYDSSTGADTSQQFEISNYDTLGNPLTYKNKTLTWTKGRQLSSYDGNTFEYNADGIRTSKTCNNVTTNFVLNGTKILSQSNGADTLIFQYGANGLVGFTLNGTDYVYQKNIFGDIIGIFDTNQNLITKYTYDSWGNCQISVDNTQQSAYNVAVKNPFRYRGYYYDTETGLYYLNSRYYDPEIGRFINADDISYANAEMLNGFNLYAYCGNNPIMNIDYYGFFSFSIIKENYKVTIFQIFNRSSIGAYLLGNLDISYVNEVILKDSQDTLYTLKNIGSEYVSYGFGLNINNTVYIEMGFQDNLAIYSSLNIQNSFYLNTSFGLNGIGLSVGIIINGQMVDFSINIGIATLALAAAVVLAPVSIPFVALFKWFFQLIGVV